VAVASGRADLSPENLLCSLDLRSGLSKSPQSLYLTDTLTGLSNTRLGSLCNEVTST
jgi:hypothetical protein